VVGGASLRSQELTLDRSPRRPCALEPESVLSGLRAEV